jgi:type IX secretion system PorP/SprF family membrane protein
MANKLLFGLLLITVFFKDTFAQDPSFTQFYAAPVYLNPAFAGTARCPRLVMNYRNQWPALSGTYVTYAASYDQHFDGLQGGLGFLVMNDKAGEGTLTTTNVSAIYSYQLNVTRQFSIKAGFQATYAQKRLDWDKLTFGDMIDPRYGFVYGTQEARPNENRSYFDLSAGILAYSSKVYGGFAVHHLTEPNEGFITVNQAKLPRRYTLHAGVQIPLATKTRGSTAFISPNIMYQQQQNFNQFNTGVYLGKGPLIGGLWYRFNTVNSDAVMILVGIQQGRFKFGYSYDVTVSKLAYASAGSHELSFGFQFECRPKKKKFRTISCPSF